MQHGTYLEGGCSHINGNAIIQINDELAVPWKFQTNYSSYLPTTNPILNKDYTFEQRVNKSFYLSLYLKGKS